MKFTCPSFCFCFFIISFLFLTVSPCSGTTIVAMRTPDFFVIAADSLSTFKGGKKPQSSGLMCKILQKGSVVFATAGLVKDPQRGFDSNAIVSKSLQASSPLSTNIKMVEASLSQSFQRELERLRYEEPSLFKKSRSVTVLLARYEKNQPIASGIQFLGEPGAKGTVLVKTKTLSCPGDCPRGQYIFYLGETSIVKKFMHESGHNLQMSPEEAVRFMVQLEIDAGTPGVGPPIDVLRLDKNGIKWLSRKKKCYP